MYITTEKEYGPGSLLTFDAEAPGKATALTVDITPVQDLHGQSNPYPPGGGVNKLPPMVDGTYEGNGVKAVVSNGVATLSGTTTASGNALIIPLQSSYTFVGGEYLHLGNSAVGSWQPSFENASNPAGGVTAAVSPANRIVQVASGKAGYEVTRIRFYLGNGVTISGTLAPMICTNNTARAYAPYSNVCPISGWSEANVAVCGKNLYPYSTFPAYTYSWYSHRSFADAINPVFLKGGVTYVLSGERDSQYTSWFFMIRMFDINKQVVTDSTKATTEIGAYTTNYNSTGQYFFPTGTGATYLYQTFTPTIDCWIDVVVQSGKGIALNAMIEAGTTAATAYEPYNGTDVTFDLDGVRYGGKLNVLTGVLTVDYTGGVLDGSEGWQRGSGATWFYRGVSGTYRTGASAAYTSHFKSVYNQVNAAWMIYGQIHVYPDTTIAPSGNTAEGLAEFKAWLAQNNVDFYTKLVTPLTVQLTPQEVVTTLVGTNNVLANTGNTFLRVAEFLETGDSSAEQFKSYLEALRGDFTKLAKLEFLNPGGDVAFTLDNNPLNKRSGAFLQSGSLSCNLQNGRRRQASVTLHNLDHAYEYAVEHIWFGQQIRLSEGLILPDGTEFYIPQGVFEIESPAEALKPGQRTVTYNLVDKWCNLDGTHFGNLEDVYSVTAGTNILAAVAALLKLDRFTAENNGANPIDPVTPVFTNYYNDKTQTLTDGTVVSLIQAPYDFLSASTGTYADVVLGLAEMIAGDVGYNQTGRLVINPSQDDIADQNKPILWEFTENDKTFLGADYSPKPADVYNDVIVVGATGDDNLTPRGRAQNLDPTSDTCVNRIGRKTIRLEMPNYYSDTICQDYAMWQLKRYSTMSKAVTVTCTQMFHIVENQLITIQRQDKPGSPIERHVVQGFTRPIGQTGTMTINCISTEDYPNATLVSSDLI